MDKQQKIDTQDFSFLIEKAAAVEEGGDMYVEGIATTPNIDLENEAMSPEAIEQMMKAINDGSIPLVDEHGKGWADKLGTIVKATLDDRHQLYIRAKLDPINPKSKQLYQYLKNGAQLGLSVAGRVKNSIMDVVDSIGKQVKTYTDVILTEVSVTQRPANFDTWLVAKGGWTGTIAKSIKQLSDKTMSAKDIKKSEEVPVEGNMVATEEPKAEEKAAEVVEVKEEAKPEEKKEEAVAEKSVEETTEKSQVSKAKAMAAFKEAMKAMTDAMNMMTETDEESSSKAMDDSSTTTTTAKAEETTTETETEKSLKISEAMIQKAIASNMEYYEKNALKVVGGVRRVEEMVRAKAEEYEKRFKALESQPMPKKSIASAQPLQKSLAGAESVTAVAKETSLKEDLLANLTIQQ